MNQRSLAILIMAASIIIDAPLILLWLLGVITNLGGALIHLLLVLAIIIALAGFIPGAILLARSGRK